MLPREALYSQPAKVDGEWTASSGMQPGGWGMHGRLSHIQGGAQDRSEGGRKALVFLSSWCGGGGSCWVHMVLSARSAQEGQWQGGGEVTKVMEGGRE